MDGVEPVLASLDLSPPVAALCESLVSSRVGVIKRLIRSNRGAEQPIPPFIFYAHVARFDYRSDPVGEQVGIGKGETEDEAVAGAVGEAVERYCAAQPRWDGIIRAQFVELDQRAIQPENFVLYSQRQYARPDFPFRQFDERREIAWARAHELPEESEALVPAGLLYLHECSLTAEERLCPSTSNGLAAGSDLASAACNGLYELIERDAFLTVWLNRLSMPRLDFSRLDGLPGAICAHYARFGIDVQVFCATLDIPIYVMIGLAVDRSGRGPSAVIGLGCHPDPTIALKKALLEVCQGMPGERARASRARSTDHPRRFEEVIEPRDHRDLFSRPEMLSELAFLLDTPHSLSIANLPTRAGGDAQADLSKCVTALNRVGSRVLYADVTTPDITPLGLRVVRTIATKLQPLHFGYGLERLGGSRLFEVRRKLGIDGEPASQADLNPCPHPLA